MSALLVIYILDSSVLIKEWLSSQDCVFGDQAFSYNFPCLLLALDKKDQGGVLLILPCYLILCLACFDYLKVKTLPCILILEFLDVFWLLQLEAIYPNLINKDLVVHLEHYSALPASLLCLYSILLEPTLRVCRPCNNSKVSTLELPYCYNSRVSKLLDNLLACYPLYCFPSFFLFDSQYKQEVRCSLGYYIGSQRQNCYYLGLALQGVLQVLMWYWLSLYGLLDILEHFEDVFLLFLVEESFQGALEKAKEGWDSLVVQILEGCLDLCCEVLVILNYYLSQCFFVLYVPLASQALRR